MSTYNISCTIGTTNPTTKLGIEVWVDDLLIFNSDHVTTTTQHTWDLNEIDGEHELRFVMKGKTTEDTQVDEAGNIVKDASITIENIVVDGIELKQIFINLAEYTHDFNGTQDTVTAKFYGEMGCNGTVSLKFTSPFYLWLLENM